MTENTHKLPARCSEDAAAQKKQQAATKTSNVKDYSITVVLKLNNIAGNIARSTVVNNLKQTRSGFKHVQERIGTAAHSFMHRTDALRLIPLEVIQAVVCIKAVISSEVEEPGEVAASGLP